VALLVLLLLAPSGCIGIGYGWLGTRQGTLEQPWARRHPMTGQRLVSEWQRSGELAARSAWGEPDARDARPDGSERWTYRAGLRWSGLVLHVVIVPLPLVVPVGRQSVTFTIRDGRVASAESRDTVFLHTWVCGYVLSHGAGFVCGGESTPSEGFHNPFE
jgi:hypothetical protein